MDQANDDPLLTVTEVLDILGVTRSTFSKWRRTQRTPPMIRLPNGSLRIRRSDLDRWLDQLTDEDEDAERRNEAEDLLRSGKRLPLHLYGPPTRDVR